MVWSRCSRAPRPLPRESPRRRHPPRRRHRSAPSAGQLDCAEEIPHLGRLVRIAFLVRCQAGPRGDDQAFRAHEPALVAPPPRARLDRRAWRRRGRRCRCPPRPRRGRAAAAPRACPLCSRFSSSTRWNSVSFLCCSAERKTQCVALGNREGGPFVERWIAQQLYAGGERCSGWHGNPRFTASSCIARAANDRETKRGGRPWPAWMVLLLRSQSGETQILPGARARPLAPFGESPRWRSVL